MLYYSHTGQQVFDGAWDMAKLLLQPLAISYNYGSNGKVINRCTPQRYARSLKKMDNHI